MRHIHSLSGIDFNHIQCNDIFEIRAKFGIEAARAALLKEMHAVLSFDGSYVNMRHYMTIVDWMTWNGNITALTRHGVKKMMESATPLKRATFEQPVEIFHNAAVKGLHDELTGVSEQLLIGKEPRCGSHFNGCITEQKYQEQWDKDDWQPSGDEEENIFEGADTWRPMQNVAPDDSWNTHMTYATSRDPWQQPQEHTRQQQPAWQQQQQPAWQQQQQPAWQQQQQPAWQQQQQPASPTYRLQQRIHLPVRRIRLQVQRTHQLANKFACKSSVFAYKSSVFAYNSVLANWPSKFACKSSVFAYKSRVFAYKSSVLTNWPSKFACKSSVFAYKSRVFAYKSSVLTNWPSKFAYNSPPGYSPTSPAYSPASPAGYSPASPAYSPASPTYSPNHKRTGTELESPNKRTRKN